jgi:hypothetical protein
VEYMYYINSYFKDYYLNFTHALLVMVIFPALKLNSRFIYVMFLVYSSKNEILKTVYIFNFILLLSNLFICSTLLVIY